MGYAAGAADDSSSSQSCSSSGAEVAAAAAAPSSSCSKAESLQQQSRSIEGSSILTRRAAAAAAAAAAAGESGESGSAAGPAPDTDPSPSSSGVAAAGAAGAAAAAAGVFASNEFHWTSQGISHVQRRKMILERHPEVEKLNGYDIRAGVYAAAVTILNIWIAYKISCWDISMWTLMLLTYTVSGSLNHILFLSMHEACHCALFPYRSLHKYFAIFVNLSMGVPAGVSFIIHHQDHHVYLGTDKKDPDLPTETEAKMFSSAAAKLLFVLLLPFTYTLRPLLLSGKQPSALELINFIVVILWDAAVYIYWGPCALFYLIAGSFFSMSFHPLNGHLIAEHYQFPWGQALQETYSSYGYENIFTFCVGYHTEHHDFPSIPGYRLPQLHAAAKEFYDLPYHKSWLHCLVEFIFNPNVTPFCRVKRKHHKGGPVDPPHKLLYQEPAQLGSYWKGPLQQQQQQQQQQQGGEGAELLGCQDTKKEK